MDFEEFKKLSRQDQQMQIIDLMIECRREGHSWELAVQKCHSALDFALGALKALGRGPETVEAVLIKMLLMAYETLARKELGEE